MTTWKIVSLLLLEKYVLACFLIWHLAECKGDRERIKGSSLEKKSAVCGGPVEVRCCSDILSMISGSWGSGEDSLSGQEEN